MAIPPVSGKPGLGGLCQRIHAHMMEQCKGSYEPLVRERKQALLGDVRGTVLEIGPGAGPNLAYYPRGITWVGVEPNPHMHPYLRAEAARRGIPVELRGGSAEELPAEDGGVDAVVSTLVLCSVADVGRALAEVRRVLRPGGRFVFLEHVAAPAGTSLRLVQNVLQPLWTPLADGCRPNRETWAAIEAAGFARVELAHFRLPVAPVGPHIAGVAVR
jgi:SAM-dependent methyltransferase